MSHVTCHVPSVACHMSHITCHMSQFFLFFLCVFFFFFFGQSGEANRWRVCFQLGLPRQVYDWKHHLQPLGRGSALNIFPQRITYLINHKGVCRTAPATPGLLITLKKLNKPAAQAAGKTFPDAAPPIGKIRPFSKIAVTFEPIQRFKYPLRFRISEKMSK